MYPVSKGVDAFLGESTSLIIPHSAKREISLSLSPSVSRITPERRHFSRSVPGISLDPWQIHGTRNVRGGGNATHTTVGLRRRRGSRGHADVTTSSTFRSYTEHRRRDERESFRARFPVSPNPGGWTLARRRRAARNEWPVVIAAPKRPTFVIFKPVAAAAVDFTRGR